jgi:HEAT repeat protein
MPMTLLELKQQLGAIEPDESTYAALSPEDVLLLETLLDDEEDWLAARAVHALARIDSSRARSALVKASGNARPEIRIAVASIASYLPPRASNGLLGQLLDDPDAGVRKFAIRSVSERNSAPVRSRLRELAAAENDPILRASAREQAEALES